MPRVRWVVLLLGMGSAAMAQPLSLSFEDLDTDATGTLSPNEVGALFAQLAELGAAEAGPRRDYDPDPDVIFSRWDADGDGAVSREEFEVRPRRGPPPDPDYDRERPRRPFVL